LFFASKVPTSWALQKDLAALLLSLGLTGEAVDVYTRLGMWEEVIKCYQQMGKTDKAESVVRAQLAVAHSPSLLCCLGDVTREPRHYLQAWEMSGQRSARAMRGLAYVYFNQGQYQKSMECFATSLDINSLQIPVWFTYGCSAMACAEWSVGVKAFRRCVFIEYDNFEAWSNLATCYVKLKEIHKAYATLQDALKCNYENWKLWENNLIVGIDCGQFTDVIHSYHRLMDLKGKWIDLEILSILTRAVIENIPDTDGVPASKYISKLKELFGRITSKVTTEGDIWMNYAKLTSAQIAGHTPDMDKSLQYLQKAYRCFTQDPNWEKDADVCKKVAEQAMDLANIHVQCTDGKSQQESLRLLSAAKLMLRGCLVKVQKQHTDPINAILSSDVVSTCQSLDEALETIVEKIDALKTS